ncbi:hypothetical protein RRG08_028858 [Elysia crispata]|uniref:Uncharacterized protein n=1 Tax=Elysia crispata TaxID=231223 RepID=A0AAE1D768_9GAST|nr:hypothetical protein RRG08_028858 [Elysia crispata]
MSIGAHSSKSVHFNGSPQLLGAPALNRKQQNIPRSSELQIFFQRVSYKLGATEGWQAQRDLFADCDLWNSSGHPPWQGDIKAINGEVSSLSDHKEENSTITTKISPMCRYSRSDCYRLCSHSEICRLYWSPALVTIIWRGSQAEDRDVDLEEMQAGKAS